MNWLYRILRKTRPAQLAVVLKRVLRIERRVVKTSSGHRLWIDPVSHFGGEVLETKSYETVLSQLLCTLLRPGDTFLDIGANEGFFSILASGRVGREGKVFCIEPQSRLIPIIEKNLELLREDSGIDNVTLVQKAFADSEGEKVLYLTQEINSGGTSFFKRSKLGAGEEKVPTTTLDHFFKANSINRIRSIKLDCEGAELSVINGAKKILGERKVDFVSVDYHVDLGDENAPATIDRFLRESGYRLSQAGTGIWVYHLPGLEEALRPLGISKEVPPFAA